MSFTHTHKFNQEVELVLELTAKELLEELSNHSISPAQLVANYIVHYDEMLEYLIEEEHLPRNYDELVEENKELKARLDKVLSLMPAVRLLFLELMKAEYKDVEVEETDKTEATEKTEEVPNGVGM